MKAFAGFVMMAALLAGCSGQGSSNVFSGSRQSFNGQYYSTKVTQDETRPEVFQVSVGNLDRGIEGAIEAGRYAAYTYCLRNFGLTRINWYQGPDVPHATLRIADGRMAISGECEGWV
ncbi:hypothetical protein [Pseudooceanicola sp. LIPI14-2-Ac024]|uniref:hypothetical protein n=1 Tax=Pseudooceanicola sp. LIPI14-2-Ac024 TaxID=3344875 RepID=UPI0035D0169D